MAQRICRIVASGMMKILIRFFKFGCIPHGMPKIYYKNYARSVFFRRINAEGSQLKCYASFLKSTINPSIQVRQHYDRKIFMQHVNTCMKIVIMSSVAIFIMRRLKDPPALNPAVFWLRGN